MALDEDLELPRDLGPYTLLKRLAVGGMAEVYVAKTKGIGGFEKQVAVKVIHPRYSEDEHFVQMLVEEAKISVLLTHVNIAQTFDLGRAADQYYIVMEYIEGADAYRVMRKCAETKRAMPIDVAAYIVAEMCNGLDYAHRKRAPDGTPLSIVHRDISPQNVLISFSGEVKLVDFGIAKAASRSEQTEAGVIKGKYYYMSPEQAWGDPMDHRSDIFSTGVVLYELLTGRMLYTDDNVVVLLDKVRKADIPPPEKRRPSIPKALSDIVMKALAKSPDDRYQSAQELAQALTNFLYTASPAFSAARLGELMGQLYPEQAQRHSSHSIAPPAREPSTPTPPPPAKSAADMSGWEDEDDETRHDVLPFRRLSRAADEAAKREAPRPVAGRDPRLGTAPVEAPLRRSDDTSTDDSNQAPGQWEDPTHLRGRDDFDDSTMVESGDAMRDLRAQLKNVPGVKVVESGRGRVNVNLPQPRPAAPPRPKPASVPPPPRAGAWAPPAPPAPPTGAPASRPLAPPPSPQRPEPTATESLDVPLPQRADHRAPTRPLASAQAPPAPPTLLAAPLPSDPFGTRDDTGPVATAQPWPPTAPVQPPPAAPWPSPPADPFSPPPASTTVGTPAVELGRPQPVRWLLSLVFVLALVVGAAVAVAWLFRSEPAPPALVVATTPPGAEVYLDGSRLPGVTPLMISSGLVEGQSYSLEVRLDGYSTWRATIVAAPGTTTQEITLTTAAARLRVETDPPGAAISINGAPVGTSPLEVASLFLGQRLTVRASLPGYVPAQQVVELAHPEERVVLTLTRAP